MRKFVLLFVLGLGLLSATAQTQTTPATKVGWADVDYIFSLLPDSKRIETELKTTQTMLKTQIDTKAQEFQKKLADYQQHGQEMLEAVRTNTERELQQLQQNLEKLQQDAQTTIQNKQTQLMAPVYDKVSKAINEVAKENGYTFILSAQIGGLDVVLYGDDGLNVSDLVLKKLGVAPKPEVKTPAPNQPK
jgi:outer membrane protein